MSTKRIRNKKIENTQGYPILLESQIDTNKLQEHLEINLITGMEEDEKDEIHLKTALKNQRIVIPVPKIETLEVNDNDSLSMYRKPKEYLKCQEDVENKYILCANDKEMIKNNKIRERDFYQEITKVKTENEKIASEYEQNKTGDVLWSYAQDRVLLLHDEHGFNSYACFRKRLVKAPRKSRKVEGNIFNNIKKLWEEVNTLNSIASNLALAHTKEYEEFRLNLKIYKTSAILCKDKKLQKKIVKNVIGRKQKEKEVLFYKKYTFEEILHDRKKIEEFHMILRENKMTEESVKYEAREIQKYLDK